MLYVESHILIHAPCERVRRCYLDFHHWHVLFPKTINKATLLRRQTDVLTIEVDHKKAGRVRNVLTIQSDGDIRLDEWKPLYQATFINHFVQAGEDTCYYVYGKFNFTGRYKLLRYFIKPLVRRRLNEYLLTPVKIYVEAPLSH